MTTITKTIKSNSGKIVDLTINIENAKVTGSAICSGLTMTITGSAVVQGRKCLCITGGPAPYLPIDNSLYSKIDSTARQQFAAQMTPLEIAEGEMREAERRYNKVFAQGYNNVAIIEAREEWDRWSAEYHRLLKG